MRNALLKNVKHTEGFVFLEHMEVVENRLASLPLLAPLQGFCRHLGCALTVSQIVV